MCGPIEQNMINNETMQTKISMLWRNYSTNKRNLMLFVKIAQIQVICK